MGYRREFLKSHFERLYHIMSQVGDAITKLQGDVAALTTADTAAVTLLNGLSTQLAKVIAELAANGVTPDQMQALTDLSAAIETNTTNLAAAVTANTPAAPTDGSGTAS